jgi:CxxC motif-containing protein
MEITCITCPNGCQLTVESTAKGMIVKGNKCPKGEAYGREEAADPKRVVTAVVRTNADACPFVPVKTSKPVPKKLIAGLLKDIYAMQVALPARRGQAAIKNYKALGIDVIFTRTVLH